MKDPKRTPTLKEIESALKRIEHLLPELRESIRWLFSLGYGGGSSGEARRYALGDVSNPTAGAVESKAQSAIRSHQRRAGNDALDAALLIANALGACRDAFKAADHGTPEESSPGPRTVTRAELAEAERAKARREGRGQGWGAA